MEIELCINKNRRYQQGSQIEFKFRSFKHNMTSTWRCIENDITAANRKT